MKNEVCVRCDGTGNDEWFEDGRMVVDPCYRCSGTGRVDARGARYNALEQVAICIANMNVDAWHKAVNSDPDGDGISLHAAENGMNERDYLEARFQGELDNVLSALCDWSEDQQDTIIAMHKELEAQWLDEVCREREAARAKDAHQPTPDDLAMDECPF